MTNPRDSFNYAALPYNQYEDHRTERVETDLPADWFPMTTIRGRSTTACPLFNRISLANTLISETDEVTPSHVAPSRPAIEPWSFPHIGFRREHRLRHSSGVRCLVKSNNLLEFGDVGESRAIEGVEGGIYGSQCRRSNMQLKITVARITSEGEARILWN